MPVLRVEIPGFWDMGRSLFLGKSDRLFQLFMVLEIDEKHDERAKYKQLILRL